MAKKDNRFSHSANDVRGLKLERMASDLQNKHKKSFQWLLLKMENLKQNKITPGGFDQGLYRSRLFGVGEIFVFHYDAKWKYELPYWDKFPLCIPLKIYTDGFLGLNLHYLPYDLRIQFLNKLIPLASQSFSDNRLRMQVNYDLLNSSTKFNAFVPCLKRYLGSHIKSQILRIQPEEWDLVAHVPNEAFRQATKGGFIRQASKAKVWEDSRAKIK